MKLDLKDFDEYIEHVLWCNDCYDLPDKKQILVKWVNAIIKESLEASEGSEE